MQYEKSYQYALIILGVLVSLVLSLFYMRELFPEYRVFQNSYLALEEFRTTYTGEPLPQFKSGVKQIVLENKENGPVQIDRCISCHVATQYSHFSPTRIARDINGVIQRDEYGDPLKEENPEYIFTKLEEVYGEDPEKILELTTVTYHGKRYDLKKVLKAHPLMGQETRPFEFHPIDEYGCTSCHSGNGRGLTTQKAHGPVFDGQYEAEFKGPEPKFLEEDVNNDPLFSKVFNHKPNHTLLFQVKPILVGSLIESSCMQCHKTNKETIEGALNNVKQIEQAQRKDYDLIQQSKAERESALNSLNRLYDQIMNQGYEQTVDSLERKTVNYTLSESKREEYEFQYHYLQKLKNKNAALKDIEKQINSYKSHKKSAIKSLGEDILSINTVPDFKGSIDRLTLGYQKGQELFLSNACYACHRIDGFSRGGVGDDLTEIGTGYLWEIKESIVWPQGNLETSTMPNFRLDHAPLEHLMTFLLAQKGENEAVSTTAYKTEILEWEAGKKRPWEKAIDPANLENVNYAMTVFATEGCAACHRLKGYTSQIELKANESASFKKMIPEGIRGSDLVKILTNQRSEIEEKIIVNPNIEGQLEALDKNHKGLVLSYYSDFAFARRARDHELTGDALQEWVAFVDKVLYLYVQEYGLGRLIGPRPNWAGIYRSDEWLFEHFRQPSKLVARSIMPVMPFDDTKFYALTHMLNVLAVKNLSEIKKVWRVEGFQPAYAYDIFCAQCHGDYRSGNGPVAEWVYPIPKNLQNVTFLREHTKENVMQSITHGVLGTPMPPWGEVGEGKQGLEPVLSKREIEELTQWLYSQLPATDQEVQVPKWDYTPEDVLKEIQQENFQSYLTPLFDPNKVFVSLSPKISVPADIFEEVTNPYTETEIPLYYIKPSYYTKKNIEAGEAFFQLNCAVCHGTEADGAGNRAGAMTDAKPRMLTNLPWLATRDDIRLLRSIKYGVPGTSMTPWGDLTSALQRLQLVIYIRSLTSERILRERLFTAIYQSFDQAEQTVDKARIEEGKSLDLIKNQLKKINVVEMQALKEEEAVALLKKKISLEKEQKELQKLDHILLSLKDLIRKEGVLYKDFGQDLIRKSILGEPFEAYIKFLESLKSRYLFVGKLKQTPIKETKAVEELSSYLDELIAFEKKKIETLLGRIPTAERDVEEMKIYQEIGKWEQIKIALIKTFSEGKRMQEQQELLFKEYQSQWKKN